MINDKAILLVEDDDVDAKTVRRALQDLNVSNPLDRTHDGAEALAYLRDTSHGVPGLILLDLNLPVMTGVELLQSVKADPRLRRIPVVVLTTSRLEMDKLATFDLSVAGYMLKPVDYIQFVEVVRTIDLYWSLSETP